MRSRGPTRAQEQAFLAAVMYASVFDYPLTSEQLHETLVGVPADVDDVPRWYAASDLLQGAIEQCDGYYFPRGRRDLLETRHAREVISRRVLQEFAKPLALILRMPFVRMVALSGSLAHLNGNRGADLDLFVVTKARRAWTVMVTLIVCARLFGWRQRLCINYVVSDQHLSVEPQDLFSANQIVHLRPLIGGDVYRAFLAANYFVADFYPNFRPRQCEISAPRSIGRRVVERMLGWTVAPFYERACRTVYGWHLRRRAASWQSCDQVRLAPECLKLHTSSHRHSVMERFEIALAEARRATPEVAMHARAGR